MSRCNLLFNSGSNNNKMQDTDNWMEEKMTFPTTVDEKLLNAQEMAIESGRLTPLIKEELWTKIQARRLSNGLEELHVQFNKPEKSSLTEEEKMKADIRRQKNREAAQRCRTKRKAAKDVIEQECEELTNRNKFLKEEVARLEAEKQEFLQKLSCCTNANSSELTIKADEEVEEHFSTDELSREKDLQIVPKTPTIDDYIGQLSPVPPPPPPYPLDYKEMTADSSSLQWDSFSSYFLSSNF